MSKLSVLEQRCGRALIDGEITEVQYEEIAGLITQRREWALHQKKVGTATVGAVLARKSIFPKRRLQRSPDRAESIKRRRLLAASGPMPPAQAAVYTTGQLSVLKIIGDEIREKGCCTLCVAAIAARAGVSHRWAQETIKLAEGDEHLVVQKRPRPGDRHDTSIIRSISREWTAWLMRGRGGGRTAPHPSDSKDIKKGFREAPGATRSARARFRSSGLAADSVRGAGALRGPSDASGRPGTN